MKNPHCNNRNWLIVSLMNWHMLSDCRVNWFWTVKGTQQIKPSRNYYQLGSMKQWNTALQKKEFTNWPTTLYWNVYLPRSATNWKVQKTITKRWRIQVGIPQIYWLWAVDKLHWEPLQNWYKTKLSQSYISRLYKEEIKTKITTLRINICKFYWQYYYQQKKRVTSTQVMPRPTLSYQE